MRLTFKRRSDEKEVSVWLSEQAIQAIQERFSHIPLQDGDPGCLLCQEAAWECFRCPLARIRRYQKNERAWNVCVREVPGLLKALWALDRRMAEREQIGDSEHLKNFQHFITGAIENGRRRDAEEQEEAAKLQEKKKGKGKRTGKKRKSGAARSRPVLSTSTDHGRSPGRRRPQTTTAGTGGRDE